MYHSVQEFADLLKVDPRTLRRLIRAGKLEAVKVGKEWRIPGSAVEGLSIARPHLPVEPPFMTTAEFLRLPQTNLPVQLIKGQVARDPAPYVPHQLLVGRLHIILHRGIVEPGDGIALLSPTDVVLSDDTVLQPDLLAVGHARSHMVGRRVEGPPDLVVEVEAENTRERDLTSKRMLYAKHGVTEFWFVSGNRRLVYQLSEPSSDDYRVKAVLQEPASLTSVAFPGLRFPLSELFAGQSRDGLGR
jgi:excisionase family DNA binding protein